MTSRIITTGYQAINIAPAKKRSLSYVANFSEAKSCGPVNI